MVRRSMRFRFCLLPLVCAAWGCSGGSGGSGGSPGEGGSSSPDVDATSMADSGGGAGDAGPTGSADASPRADSGAIAYAASCGDGGGAPRTPTGNWVNATGALAGLGSECGNLSDLWSKPNEDMLIAGVAQQGLWASKSGGAWAHLGTGSGSSAIVNRTSCFFYDPMNPDTFWESGIYNSTGVYQTSDDGTTFHALGNVTHNDSISVDLTDPQRKTLLAGTHEQSGHLFLSIDRGVTWTDIGPKLPAGTGFSSQALVIDAMTFLVGTYTYSNTGAGLGVFRSIDGGATWTQVFSSPVQGHPLVMADGTIYWSVGSGGGLVASADKGQTWHPTVGKGVLVTGAPVALPDGRIAALSSQAVMVSADCGTTWHAATTALPYTPTGLVYSPYQKAFYVWHFDCTGKSNPADPVPTDAIMRFAFDYQSD